MTADKHQTDRQVVKQYIPVGNSQEGELQVGRRQEGGKQQMHGLLIDVFHNMSVSGTGTVPIGTALTVGTGT